MFFSVFGIRSRISVLLLAIFLLLPSTCGQPPQSAQGGIVTIEDLSAFSAQPTDVQLCLWEPGHKDVASTVGCPTPVANTCYCPTGIVQQAAVLSAITGCMTYWYSVTGGIKVAAATSVYNEYCQNATGIIAIPTTSISTTIPRSTSITTTSSTTISIATTSIATTSITTTSTPTSTPTSNLAPGAIAGIAIGSVVAVLLAVFFLLYCLYPKFNSWFNNKFKSNGDAG
ncbi:hypothetical protein V8E54_003301 [Elaphomyces granulatus]